MMDRDELILNYKPFVNKMAKKYVRGGATYDDLVQEGMIGLIHAAEKFVPTYGHDFSTYARYWVKGAMMNYVYKNCTLVNAATSKPYRKLFANLYTYAQMNKTFTKLQRETIAADLNVTEEQVAEMEARMNAQYLDSGVMVLEATSDPLYDVMTEERDQLLYHAILGLNEVEQDIIRTRWLGWPRQTLQELAKYYSVSHQAIHGREVMALQRLKLILNGVIE